MPNGDFAPSRVLLCVQVRRRAARLARLAPEGREGARRSARLRKRPTRRHSVPRNDRAGVDVSLRAYDLLVPCITENKSDALLLHAARWLLRCYRILSRSLQSAPILQLNSKSECSLPFDL